MISLGWIQLLLSAFILLICLQHLPLAASWGMLGRELELQLGFQLHETESHNAVLALTRHSPNAISYSSFPSHTAVTFPLAVLLTERSATSYLIPSSSVVCAIYFLLNSHQYFQLDSENENRVHRLGANVIIFTPYSFSSLYAF